METIIVAVETAELLGAEVHLNLTDRMLWDTVYGTALGAVFTDTLFNGGPGATCCSFSSFDAIIDSIRDTLLTLPAGTIVYTGHNDLTTIGTESPNLDEWSTRGPSPATAPSTAQSVTTLTPVPGEAVPGLSLSIWVYDPGEVQ